jgi:hypothetical protein
MPSIPPDFRIALLVAGILLLLIALFGGRLLGSGMAARLRMALRLGIALLGLALIGWVLAGYLGARVASSTPAVTAKKLPVDLVRLASAQIAACALPNPPAVPDASSASLQDISAARQAFEAYDAATAGYAKCVDAAIDRVARQQGAAASPQDVAGLRVFGTTAHNTAIDQEQAIANQLNAQLRAYKAQHPK